MSELLNISRLDSIVSEFMYSHMVFFAIIFAAFVGQTKEKSKRSMLYAWLVYFVGTFLHELSHFALSLIFNGKPIWFSVFPKMLKDSSGNKSYLLGHVKSSNIKWYNVFFVSMSPFLLFFIAFYVYEHFFYYFTVSTISILAYIYLIVIISFSAIPSSVDFKNLHSSGNVVLNLIPPLFSVFSLFLIFVK